MESTFTYLNKIMKNIFYTKPVSCADEERVSINDPSFAQMDPYPKVDENIDLEGEDLPP